MAPLNLLLLLMIFTVKMILPSLTDASSNDDPNEVETSLNRLLQSLDRLSNALDSKSKLPAPYDATMSF